MSISNRFVTPNCQLRGFKTASKRVTTQVGMADALQGTLSIPAVLRLLHCAFHAPFPVQPLPPCRGVRSSFNRCSPCFACRARAYPSARCHPASFEGPGLALHGQPVRRANSPLDYWLFPAYPWRARSAEESAAGAFPVSASSLYARQRPSGILTVL